MSRPPTRSRGLCSRHRPLGRSSISCSARPRPSTTTCTRAPSRVARVPPRRTSSPQARLRTRPTVLTSASARADEPFPKCACDSRPRSQAHLYPKREHALAHATDLRGRHPRGRTPVGSGLGSAGTRRDRARGEVRTAIEQERFCQIGRNCREMWRFSHSLSACSHILCESRAALEVDMFARLPSDSECLAVKQTCILQWLLLVLTKAGVAVEGRLKAVAIDFSEPMMMEYSSRIVSTITCSHRFWKVKIGKRSPLQVCFF
jgi:hypothetical protein